MAQRSLITGVFAVGIAAAAMRMGTSPQPSTSLANDSSGGAKTSIHNRGSLPLEKQAKFNWTDEMKARPEETGRTLAATELDDTLSGASSPSPKPNPCAEPQVMIAIEPDPAHTHLALFFDRDLDSLNEALQEKKWIYQAEWMPWSADAAAGNDHLVDREVERLYALGREQLPGVLIYRPSDAAAHPCSTQQLEIFIVGNSPSAGINTSQFQAAIKLYARQAPSQKTLRIIGPSFSGSGPSLRSLLADLPKLPSGANKLPNQLKWVDVASGSVSDPVCDHFLPGVINPAKQSGCTSTLGKLNFSFTSFAPDAAWVTQRTEEFLNRRAGIPYEEIAELAEDKSSYGANIIGEKGSVQGTTLKLTFPQSISHLRDAYQKSTIFGFGATTNTTGSVNLNLDFDESTGDDDDVPIFARRQMPVSQEAMMYQLTSLLREKRVRVVLLSGTDVLDEIFVAQILSRQAPNILVVVRDADDLFLRSATETVFRNMYFVSSWPLVPENQFWARSINARQPLQGPVRNFTNAYAEGVYVSAHYLLDREAGAFDPSRSIPGYGSPLANNISGKTARPPLWLCTIGDGRYWPIALLGQKPDTAEPTGVHQPAIPATGPPVGTSAFQPTPPSLRFLAVVLCILCMLHLAGCLHAEAMPEPAASHYRLNDPTTRRVRILLLLGISLLGFVLLCVSFSPAQCTGGAIAACFLIGALCLAAATALLLGRLIQWKQWQKPWVSAAILLLPVLALQYFAWKYAWNSLSTADPEEGIAAFLSFRAANPFSGASSLFSIFIAVAALAFYLYSNLGRLNLTRQTQPRLPDDTAGIPFCPNEEQMKPLTELLLYPPGPHTRHFKLIVLAGAAVAIIAIAWISGVTPLLFDGVAVRLALGTAAFLVTLAMLWDLIMASLLWKRLKLGLLDPLESSSLRRSFNDVGGLTWKTFWMPQNATSQYRAIIRLLEQSSRQPIPECTWKIDGLSDLRHEAGNLWRTVGTQPRSSEPVLEAFERVQDRIARVTRRILIGLRITWATQTARVTDPDGEVIEHAVPSEPMEKTQQAREEWVALVYLHFSRIILAQVRSRLIAAAALYFFLVWTCTSYPFLNRHVLLIALSVALAILTFVGISTYASINRDAILSRATNHTPGELDLDFFVKTGSLIGIPILTFIGSQFPEVSSFLFSWIQPGMSAIK